MRRSLATAQLLMITMCPRMTLDIRHSIKYCSVGAIKDIQLVRTYQEKSPDVAKEVAQFELDTPV